MNLRSVSVFLGGLCAIALAVVAPAELWAFQEEELMVGVLGAFGLLFVLFFAAIYAYFALALQTIAKKTNTENGWLAWIPIANVVLMLNVAQKPVWWLVLFIIPLVNIVFAVIVWMSIAKRRGKPDWWGVLIIVPIVGFIMPGILAWSD